MSVPTAVLDNEVLIDDVPFPIHGSIKPVLINQFPPKVTIGDVSKDDEQFMSTFTQNEALGGIGLFRITDKSQTERAWISYLNMAYRSGITLPQYVYKFGRPVGTAGPVSMATDYNNSVYLSIGTQLYQMAANPVEGTQKVADPTTAPTMTAQAGSTSLLAGTYYLKYAWRTKEGATGSTLLSPQGSVTITAGQQIQVTLPAFPKGVIEATLWFSQAVNDTTLKYAFTINIPTTVITTVAGSSVAQPAGNTTGVDNFGAAVYTSATGSIHDMVTWGGNLWLVTDTATIYYNGTTWTVDATPGTGGGQFLLVHDNKLWRLSGSTIYQLVGWGGTPTWNDNSASLPNIYAINKLVDFRNSLGDPSIYAISAGGAYILDESVSPPVWRLTEFVWPQNTNGGKASGVWRGDLYSYVGLDGYKFTPGNPSTVDAGVGLSKDEGVPPELDGVASRVAPAFNDIFLIVDQSVTSQKTEVPAGVRLSVPTESLRDPQFTKLPQYSSYIAQWTGSGWQIVWVAPNAAAATIPSGAIWVSTASKYRLYWSWGGDVYGIDLFPGIRNPWQNKTYVYQAGPKYHITPWFQGLADSLEKAGAALKLYCLNMSSTETITVYYGTDFSEDWHALPSDTAPNNVINTNGLTTIPLGMPTVTTAKSAYPGVSFNAIRFKFVFNRDPANNLKSPVLFYWLHQYLKFSPPRWGYNFQIDLTHDHRGRSPMELIQQLNTIIKTVPMVTLQWRDADSALPSIANVKITHLQASAQTGDDYRGVWSLSCIEPIQFG